MSDKAKSSKSTGSSWKDELKSRTVSASGGAGASKGFKHWLIETDSSAVVRFIPDQENDVTAPASIELKQYKPEFTAAINLPEGASMDKFPKFIVKLPCLTMYEGETTCPGLAVAKSLYDAGGKDKLASSLYFKKTYILQGFVVSDPMDGAQPVDALRTFQLSPQLIEAFLAGCNSPDMEAPPWDTVDGTDFRITKGRKGEFASYTTSAFVRKSRPLSADELAAIEGAKPLISFRPAKPDEAHQQAMVEILEAASVGAPYDYARWGKFFVPFGLDINKG